MSNRMKPKSTPAHWYYTNAWDYPHGPYYKESHYEDDDYYREAPMMVRKAKPHNVTPMPTPTPKPKSATKPLKSYYDDYDVYEDSYSDMTTLEAYQCGFKDGFDTALMLVQNGTIPMPAPTPTPTPVPVEPVTPPLAE